MGNIKSYVLYSYKKYPSQMRGVEILIQGPHKVQRSDLKSLSLVDREKIPTWASTFWGTTKNVLFTLICTSRRLKMFRCECFNWFYLQNLDAPDNGNKKITSDAMLCCPGCMITVCIDCQRLVIYSFWAVLSIQRN